MIDEQRVFYILLDVPENYDNFLLTSWRGWDDKPDIYFHITIVTTIDLTDCSPNWGELSEKTPWAVFHSLPFYNFNILYILKLDLLFWKLPLKVKFHSFLYGKLFIGSECNKAKYRVMYLSWFTNLDPNVRSGQQKHLWHVSEPYWL